MLGIVRLLLFKMCRSTPKTSVPDTAVLYTSAFSLPFSPFLSRSRMTRYARSLIDGLQLAGRASAAIY